MKFLQRLFGNKEKSHNLEAKIGNETRDCIGCPKCGGLIYEYDAHFCDYICVRCGWESKTLPKGVDKTTVRKLQAKGLSTNKSKAKTPPQDVLLQDSMRLKEPILVFQPRCVACSSAMEEIEIDREFPVLKSKVSCPNCQTRYQLSYCDRNLGMSRGWAEYVHERRSIIEHFFPIASRDFDLPMAKLLWKWPNLPFGIRRDLDQNSVAFSPGGRYFLSGGGNSLILWEITALIDVLIGGGVEEVRVFKTRGHHITSVAFSPDGKYVLSGGLEGGLYLWDISSGKVRNLSHGTPGSVLSVAFSPNGAYALAGTYAKTLHLLDIARLKFIREFPRLSGEVESVAFSPDGKYAISGTHTYRTGGGIKLWDISTGKEVRTFGDNNTSSAAKSVAFSPDGKYVLSGSLETPQLWDVTTGQEIRFFQGHSEAAQITSVAFSPDGKYALSGTDTSSRTDRGIRLWDISTGKELRMFTMNDFGGHVTSVAFSPDSKYVLSGHRGPSTQLWKIYLPRRT
jgi:hypothetical protein